MFEFFCVTHLFERMNVVVRMNFDLYSGEYDTTKIINKILVINIL